MDLKDSWGQKRRRESQAIARIKATKAQWDLVDIAIKAFIRKYTLQWIAFQEDLKTIKKGQVERKWRLWGKDDLKKANWRMSASFPVIYNKEGNEIDSLLPVIQKIIPRLIHKNSVNYGEFLRRYPCFLPLEKR